ncbi:DUF3644 domain-containing protein [Fusibacter sp. JL298sf-3]
MGIRTELISRTSDDHQGYGAGGGDTERLEYKCPCGQGKVIEEHDNIPGFRDHSLYLHCKPCRLKYEFDTSKGTRRWEMVVKKEYDTIKLDLFDNALDSFVVAIDSFNRGTLYPKYYKISIKEMFSAFELLLKDILSHEHPSLIYSKVEDYAEPIGKRHSVNFETLLLRLEKLADFKIEENHKRYINRLRELRNLGMHSSFEVNRFNAADIISKVVPIFMNLYRRFYGENHEKKLSDLLGVEIFNSYISEQTALNALINDAKKRFEDDGHKIITFEGVTVKCNTCNSEYIVHEGENIKCYCCHEEFRDFYYYATYIKLDAELNSEELYSCPDCDCWSLALYEPYDYYLCLSCGHIVDRVTCDGCALEYPRSEVDDETDYLGETAPDHYVYICYDCKHPYDDFY